MKVGIIQIYSDENKEENLRKALEYSEKVINEGAELLLLPELFNFHSPRGKKEDYIKNAESDYGSTIKELLRLAKRNNVVFIAGSIAEKVDETLYNTSYVLSKDGIIGKYRKIHLFKYEDIDESKIFSPGKDPIVVNCLGTKIGLTICFDLRFPEIFRIEALMGAEILVNVAAFLEKTGRAHWMPLLRARAIENQVFLLAANQSYHEGAQRRYYGHSCIIDPWGRCLARANEKEGFLIADIDIGMVENIRSKMPLLKLMAFDIKKR
ncbi:MAG: carbon-nitrogen hydrolase family protein [Candidatus Methanomethyliaceae archaeon]|nr:carbon-nitrogen hydrolase family protein [Candidatus Methanomethyliaceae archaeon]